MIDGALVDSSCEYATKVDLMTLDDLPFQTTEDETILSEPSEFLRVSNYIVKIHTEVVFVDPYLDLSLIHI